jgi:hypothetical protein
MQPIKPLLKLWRKWFNRNKLFKADEMNELESHLLDEIDYMKEHDGLSEEQAFQKAVQLIGQRESLDQEYDKNHGFTYPKFAFWFRNHTLQLFVASLLIIVFLVADFQFSNTHTRNVQIKTDIFLLTLEPIFSVDSNNIFKIYYTSLSGPKTSSIQWKVNQDNKSVSSPLFISPLNIFEKEYLLILDDQKQLWIEESDTFSLNSHCFKLRTNTDWLYWNHFYRSEIKKKKIPLAPLVSISDRSYLSKQPTSSFISNTMINNSLDFKIFTLGDTNTVVNEFSFMQSDQSKINISEILFCEIKEQNPIRISNYLVDSNAEFIRPHLFIRSYQLERRPLHILPFLYQKITDFSRGLLKTKKGIK